MRQLPVAVLLVAGISTASAANFYSIDTDNARLIQIDGATGRLTPLAGHGLLDQECTEAQNYGITAGDLAAGVAIDLHTTTGVLFANTRVEATQELVQFEVNLDQGSPTYGCAENFSSWRSIPDSSYRVSGTAIFGDSNLGAEQPLPAGLAMVTRAGSESSSLIAVTGTTFDFELPGLNDMAGVAARIDHLDPDNGLPVTRWFYYQNNAQGPGRVFSALESSTPEESTLPIGEAAMGRIVGWDFDRDYNLIALNEAGVLVQINESELAGALDAADANATMSVEQGQTLAAEGGVSVGRLSGLAFIAGPTANAGEDLSVRVGQTVTLDGSQSFDADSATQDLVYQWQLVDATAAEVTLSAADTVTPVLQLNVAGTYQVQLTVTDRDGLSDQDSVLVSSDGNQAPTADAGEDRLIVIGEQTFLDGTASVDPEGDPISYAWQLTGGDAGAVTLSDLGDGTASFSASQAGVYEVQLLVSDMLGAGEPDTVSVTVMSSEAVISQWLMQAVDIAADLDRDQVASRGNKRALIRTLRLAAYAFDRGRPRLAAFAISTAIERVDGCAFNGEPDGGRWYRRDWVVDCAAQATLYGLLSDIEAAMETL